VYSVRNSLFDVILMFIFGVVGYGLKKLRVPPGPLILGFILAPIMESEMRRSLRMSDGSFGIFFERPISLTVMVLIGLLILLLFVPWGKIMPKLRRTPTEVEATESR